MRVQQDKEPAVTFEELKMSVVRLTTYKTEWRWGKPYDTHTSTGSVGSGFFVSLDPPTLATCAHVVDMADEVLVQIPEFGQKKFPGTVATICNDNDIALVELDNPEEVLAELKEAGANLRALKLAEKTPTLGSDVVATGFPLGQTTLKLSTGVVSGVDHVKFHYSALALQSTAIISSGNSGSPLLDALTKDVIAVNYAKNPEEAQINYAVPLWKLKQVIAKHEEIHAKPDAKKPTQIKMVNHGLVLTPGLEALYLRSGNKKLCREGPMISDMSPHSLFRSATPPVNVDDFLVSVDGVKLDKYGQGEKSEYIDELVNFDDLLWMRGGTGEEDIKFEICDPKTGETKEHTVSMAWQPKVQGSGLQYVYEPHLDEIEWEIFGDLLFMELTENHIELMGGEFHSWALVRFLDPKRQGEPHLAVMLEQTGGDAEDALGLEEGSLAVVDTINGKKVTTLQEFRAAFVPQALQNGTGIKAASPKELTEKLRGISENVKGERAAFIRDQQELQQGTDFIWSMRTSIGNEYATMFMKTMRAQVAAAEESADQAYLMTSAVMSGATALNLLPASLLQMSVQGRASSRGRAPHGVDTHLASGPLLVTEREGSVSMVDFPKGENYMEE